MDRETGQHWGDRISPDGEDGAELEEAEFYFQTHPDITAAMSLDKIRRRCSLWPFLS